MKFSVRVATEQDIPRLKSLIEASVRGLQTGDYTPAQIEGALDTIFGVDSQLIADGTYFAVEAASNIVGCGGWSKRKTLYGGDLWRDREDSLLDPAVDAAKIRAFFVHPDWGRQGIGTLILQTCEQAATAAGFTRFEMGATLTGVPLYRKHGYAELEAFGVPLGNGETLPIVRMAKTTVPEQEEALFLSRSGGPSLHDLPHAIRKLPR